MKNDILAYDDIERRAVVVDEWRDAEGKPRTIYVRVMTAEERENLEQAVYEARTKKESFSYRALVVAATACDATGALLFDKADVPALSKKSGKVIMRLQAIAEELNKVTEESVEGAVKN